MKKNQNFRSEKGFTLIELLIVIAIIGILATIALPQFNQYRNRAYDSAVKSDLHDLYLSCKAYWGDTFSTNDCDAAIVTGTSYGWVPSPNMTITFSGTITELDFLVSASHDSSDKTYAIDPSGNITLQ